MSPSILTYLKDMPKSHSVASLQNKKKRANVNTLPHNAKKKRSEERFCKTKPNQNSMKSNKKNVWSG